MRITKRVIIIAFFTSNYRWDNQAWLLENRYLYPGQFSLVSGQSYDSIQERPDNGWYNSGSTRLVLCAGIRSV